MKYLICFVVFFILIYVIYYFEFVFKLKKYNFKKIISNVRILENYYKIDIKKIGYKKVLRIMNFINALMLSLLMMLVINLDSFIYKFLVLLLLMVPSIWVTYYFLAKYLKHLEGKVKKNV